MDRFDSFLFLLSQFRSHFGLFGPVLGCFGSFLISLGFTLGCLDLVLVILAHFRSAQVSFWILLVRFDLFWVGLGLTLGSFDLLLLFWFVLICFGSA